MLWPKLPGRDRMLCHSIFRTFGSVLRIRAKANKDIWHGSYLCFSILFAGAYFDHDAWLGIVSCPWYLVP